MNAGNAALAASLLEIERDRLLCSLQHLERSVKELKQAMVDDPDPEYKTAISENLVVIVKQRARVASLEDEIKRAKGMKGDISHAQVAAVPVLESQQQAAPSGRQTAASHAAATQADVNSTQQDQRRSQQEGAAAGMDVDYASAVGAQSSVQQQQAAPAPDAAAAGGSGGADDAQGMWL